MLLIKDISINLRHKKHIVPHTVPLLAKTIEQSILEEMELQNVSFSGLARATHTERTHLTRVLKETGREKRKLSDGLKKRIEAVLQREFN